MSTSEIRAGIRGLLVVSFAGALFFGGLLALAHYIG